jgi:glycosyltransferase involved in cell wall biosynthesis
MWNVVDRTWELRRPPVIFPNFMDFPQRPHPLPPMDREDEPLIVCVGRIEPLKGQDTLARAFAMIAPKYPRARLVIIGPDRWPGKRTFAELLPRFVPDAEIRGRIDLPGPVPLETVGQMLRAARVSVISSRGFESFSYAALEALAAARPVIATATGALPEIVQNEEGGLVVPAADAPAMADAMDRMLADRTFAQRLADAGFETARQRCHTPHVLPQIMDSYDQATTFYCQVKAARSERTALLWRRAIDTAKSQLDAERETEDPEDQEPPPRHAIELHPPRLDVA